jgi:hypothetical protein
MEQRLTQCTLSVIEGGTHGLLWRADVVSQIFKGIASSWKLAEFERSLSQRWSIKQLGLNGGGHSNRHFTYRSSAYTGAGQVQQAIQTSNIYETTTATASKVTVSLAAADSSSTVTAVGTAQAVVVDRPVHPMAADQSGDDIPVAVAVATATIVSN